jgi:hypothetical protein
MQFRDPQEELAALQAMMKAQAGRPAGTQPKPADAGRGLLGVLGRRK